MISWLPYFTITLLYTIILEGHSFIKFFSRFVISSINKMDLEVLKQTKYILVFGC